MKGFGVITFLLATGNLHKVQEIRAVLGETHVYRSLRDYPGAPVAKEDTGSFAGNATQKAVLLAQWLSEHNPEPMQGKAYVLADDSGLEVDALSGAPGVHSARFAALDSGREGNSSDADNNQKLLKLLRDVPPGQRRARFRCVIALVPARLMEAAWENASRTCYASEFELSTELFEGVCEGRIGTKACGDQGFGYDPLFYPDGHDLTFAELGEEQKNQMSHRAKALAKLRERLSRGMIESD